MSASDAVLRDLRASLARSERGTGGDATLPPISLTSPIDDHLPGGGLARGALHEVQASDLGAGLALCTLILSRTDGPVLWISAHAEGVWAPGLHALGLRADRLLQASYRQPADGLWTEALRSPAFGGAVLQIDRLDMTASRRLQLAGEFATSRAAAAERGRAWPVQPRQPMAGGVPGQRRSATTLAAGPASLPRWTAEQLGCPLELRCVGGRGGRLRRIRVSRRYLALCLPYLPLDRLRRQHPDWDDRPLAVWAAVGNRRCLTATDAPCLSPGQALADAQAILPDLILADADPDGDAAILERLALWALRFTPLSAVDGEDGLMLDTTGVEALFG
ncbi:hypothetical protein [Roseomonas sp. USHLN139]|uniref:hypothetical protein n=1 Tax=Roseomonas sp. USHLN139 TaxID=3081298 RepID=UPI003B01F7F0